MEVRPPTAPWLALCLLLPLAAGCRREGPLAPVESPVTRTEAARLWQVVEGGQPVGVVVLFSDPKRPDDPARHFYSVRNPQHQELGSLDAHGRIWRFQAHQREAQWLGTGTVIEGARKVLDAGPEAELRELSLEREAPELGPRVLPGRRGEAP